MSTLLLYYFFFFFRALLIWANLGSKSATYILECELWKRYFLVQISLLGFFCYEFMSNLLAQFCPQLVVKLSRIFGHENKRLHKKGQQLLMMWDKGFYGHFLKRNRQKTCENAHNISWPILICKTIYHLLYRGVRE